MADARSVVLDSSAVIALFLDQPGAGTVGALLRSDNVRMSSVNAAEVVDVLIRVYGADPDDVVARVDELLSLTVRSIETSRELSIQAGELRASLSRRRTKRLSMADCYVLVTAGPGDRIATTDATLAAVASDEGIEVVALDS